MVENQEVGVVPDEVWVLAPALSQAKVRSLAVAGVLEGRLRH